MIECLILILNAYYFFYELLFYELFLNNISWAKVEMFYRN